MLCYLAQAFIWLGTHNTLWVTGRVSTKDGELYQFHEESVNGNPSMGWVDPGGGTHCGQSMWDEHGRRIQFMWMGLTVAVRKTPCMMEPFLYFKTSNSPRQARDNHIGKFDGKRCSLQGNAHATGHPRFRGAYSGAQTMAREIVLAPKGSPTGLLFRPLPEVATLHSDGGANSTLHLTPNAVTTLTPKDGLHCHVIAAIAMPAAGSAASVNLRLRAFPATAVNGAGDLNVTVVQTAAGARWVSVNGLVEPFIYKNEHFAETGSIQT